MQGETVTDSCIVLSYFCQKILQKKYFKVELKAYLWLIKVNFMYGIVILTKVEKKLIFFLKLPGLFLDFSLKDTQNSVIFL